MVRRYIRFPTQNFYIWRDCTGGFCGTSRWLQKDKFCRPPKSWWHFQTLAALFLPKSLESSGMQRVLSGANNLLEASVVFVSKFEFYLGLKFPLVLHFILWFHIQLRDTLSLCSEIWLFFGAFGWKPILIPFLILTPWHWQPGFIPCLWAQPFESPYRARQKG